MLGCMKHKLESRLPGEITITSDIQMLLLLLKLLQSCPTLSDPMDADDTILIAESEELKSLLMKVKRGE